MRAGHGVCIVGLLLTFSFLEISEDLKTLSFYILMNIISISLSFAAYLWHINLSGLSNVKSCLYIYIKYV